ncbi:MAG: hypothetical protein QQN63_14680, partial [Nitrosopumilus sp.]
MNHIILPDPDLSQGLRPWIRKESDGKARIVTVAVPDALDDVLEFTGLDGVVPELKHLFSGRMSLKEYLQRRGEDAILKDGFPLPGLLSGVANLAGPVVNVPVAGLGFQTFPDPLNPRKISGGKGRAIFNALGFSGFDAPFVGGDEPGKSIFNIPAQFGIRQD